MHYLTEAGAAGDLRGVIKRRKNIKLEVSGQKLFFKFLFFLNSVCSVIYESQQTDEINGLMLKKNLT